MTPEELTDLFNRSKTQDEGLAKVYQAGYLACMEDLDKKMGELSQNHDPLRTNQDDWVDLGNWLDAKREELG